MNLFKSILVGVGLIISTMLFSQDTLKINLSYGPSYTGWANVVTSTVTLDLGDGYTLTNATMDTDGDAGITGISSYPDEVTYSYHSTFSSTSYNIDNFSQDDDVIVNILSSRTGTGSNRTTNFTIGSDTQSIDADGNTTVLTFNDCEIDDNGDLIITVEKDASAVAAYINLIEVIINPLAVATVTAGGDANIYAGQNHILSGADTTHCDSLLWSTSGTGTFNNDETLNPIYTPSEFDTLAGSVYLNITGYSGDSSIVDSMLLTINSNAISRIFPYSYGYGSQYRGAWQKYEESNLESDLPEILYVDTLSGGNFSTSDTSGTFAWCLKQNYPRIIVFLKGGEIDFSNEWDEFTHVTIPYPYVSIYGQTAPSPGITITHGAPWMMTTHDLLMMHVRIRGVDDASTWGTELSSFGGWGGCYNIVLDHCSFSWSIDQLVGINPGNNISVTNCILSEPLECNTHPTPGDECHAMFTTMLRVQNVSFIGNLFAHGQTRAPFFNSGIQDVYIANNLMYNIKYYSIYFADEYGYDTITRVDIIGNYYKPGLSTVGAADNLVYVRDNMDNGNLYLSDNYHPYTSDQTSAQMVKNDGGVTLQTTTPVTDAMGYNAITSTSVPFSIMANAGARNWDRDSTDIRILTELNDGTGTVIDSTSQLDDLYLPVGVTDTVLNIPDNPVEITTNGYSNFENWLFNVTPVIPDLDIELTSTDVTCNGANDGTITLTITTGTPPYNFLWNDGATTQGRNELSPGQYIVVVTGNLGSITTDTISITEPAVLKGSVIVNNNASCFGYNDGSATINITGGNIPNSWNFGDGSGWYSGQSLPFTKNDLPAGNYMALMSDHNLCKDTVYYTITQPLDIVLSAVITNENNSAGDGVIELTVTNGVPAYTYTWLDGPATKDRSNLSGGIYTITVTDDITCEKTGVYRIENIIPPVVGGIIINLEVGGIITINNNGGIIISNEGN